MAGCLHDIDVALLAGGLGTRIRQVLGETPKALAPLGDTALLDQQIGWLSSWGCRRIVLCLGHRAQTITRHVTFLTDDGPSIVTSVEAEPMGTAGALGVAKWRFSTSDILVLNGDTVFKGDMDSFVSAHRERRAGCTILCVDVADTSSFGGIELGQNDLVVEFRKNGGLGAGLVSAGAYLMTQSFIAQRISVQPTSLETEIFPAAARDSDLRAFRGDFQFIDIGTPEGYNRALLEGD